MTEKERIRAIIDPLISWYQKNKKSHPWREDKSPYRVWVSEIMLQQTRTAAVVPYFLRFMEKYPSVFELAAADDDELMKLWEGLGYYSRARNLKKCAVTLLEKYGGVFPRDYGSLLSLPGIGPYTAGAIASIAYGESVPAVDGNVLRVLMRTLASERDIADDATKGLVFSLLSSVYPQGERASLLTEAIMELGEQICIPNGEPHCGECPIRERCFAYEGQIQTLFPVKSPKKPRKIENRTVLVFSYRDTFYIRKRPPKGLLASLYEFLNQEGELSPDTVRHLACEAGSDGAVISDAGEAKHIFTHIEWHMRGYRIELLERASDAFVQKYELIEATRDQIQNQYSIPTAFKAYTKQL